MRSNQLNFDKIWIFHKHLRSSCGAEKKFVRKKFIEANFSNLVSYLLKILSEIYFVGKTQYEDVTETSS